MKSPLKSSVTLGVVLIFATVGITFTGPIAGSMIFTATLVLVLSSIVAAVCYRGRSRHFWRGFAVFAGCFFALLMGSGGPWVIASRHDNPFEQPSHPCFVTTYALAWLYDRVGNEEILTRGGSRVPAIHLLLVMPNKIPGELELNVGDLEVFLSNGHCLLTVIVGLLGGWLASRLAGQPASDHR